MSDSNGYIYDPDGIKLDVVKQLKEVERKRIKEYVKAVPTATYTEGCSGIWTIPCQIALPLRDAERNQRSIRQGADCQRRGSSRRRREHALDAGSHRGVPAGGRAVCPGEGCQRRAAWRFPRWK